MDKPSQEFRHILGQRVDYTTYKQATEKILGMAQNGQQGYVCISNVHMVMEGDNDPVIQRVVNGADLVTPDGVPLVWALKLLGIRAAERVYGSTLMLRVCKEASGKRIPIGLYGATEDTLMKLQLALKSNYPLLNISYSHSPPFRSLTREEDDFIINDINEKKPKILFVAIGCPKQEYWIAKHKNRIPAVMLGVGAAFDFIAGVKPQAPALMQKLGLEWLFRLISEPSRLWRRYLVNNPKFMIKFLLQIIGLKKYPPAGDI